MNDIHNLPDVHHTSSSTFLSAARTQKVNDQITEENHSDTKKKKISPNKFRNEKKYNLVGKFKHLISNPKS